MAVAGPLSTVLPLKEIKCYFNFEKNTTCAGEYDFCLTHVTVVVH